MALSVPTNITPSTSSGLGAGVVDVTQGFTVSWQVNGSSPMTAYQYVIMQNDTASTQVYDSGQITLAEPFYGKDYNGNVQFFSFDIPASSLTSMTNGYANGYKAVITQWWSSTESLTQPSASFFITRSLPTIQIDAIPSPLSAKSYIFSAQYTQAQGDTLDWFRWVLQDSNGNVLNDTQEIYGTEDIRMEYDGFFSGESYTVQCFIQTESGVQAQTTQTEFDVSYATTTITGLVNACQQGEGVMVSWPNLAYIFGTAEGNYTISNNILNLPSGSSVTWNSVTGNPMSFSPSWWMYYKGKPQQGTFLTLGGVEISFSLTASTVAMSINGQQLVSVMTQYIGEEWLEILLTPTTLTVYTTISIGGLAPSLTLVPSLTLAPQDNTQSQEFYYTNPIQYTQQTISQVSLYGPQSCNFVWISRQELQLGQTPEFDTNSYFVADFKNDLNAGNVTNFSGDVIGAAIYRQDNQSAFLNHICDIPIANLSMLDYGAPSQGTYTYYVFFIGETTYLTAPIISNSITPVFWNWTVLQCEMDTNGVYHVLAQFPFSLNISTSEITNNNNPTILENFTIYPKVQPASANYSSGTLQAYIGSIDTQQWQYVDSVTQAQAIYALSLSTYPLFLRDRKGNLWRIMTGAPITMQSSDNTRQQLYFMTLQWVETGQVDGPIVLTASDALWEVVQ